MVKHHLRVSINSLLRSHIDPDKAEQLHGTKAEAEDKVKSILKLIKDDNIGEDGTPVELSKKESLVELIEDFHNQYQSLHAQYDNLTGELRKGIKGNKEKGSSSSSSDSDSDHSSKEKDSKNGKLENEFQKTTDKQQELEVADLNRKLTITQEEKEDLNSKYLAALSKIQESEKINMDLKTDAEALRTQGSKLSVENAELNKQLGIAGKIEAELSQRLEELKTEKDILTMEKETALQQIDEEKNVTDGLRITVDQLTDDKLALEKELQTGTGQLPILKQQLEHSRQEMTNISHKLRVSEEESESLKAKHSQASNEIQLARNKIQELEAESSQLKEKLNDRERAISALAQMHEGHRKETLNNQLRDTNRERELDPQDHKILVEQLVKIKADLKGQIEELQGDDPKGRSALKQRVKSLQKQKSDLEVQLVQKVQENSDNVIQIQTLKAEIDRKTLEQEKLLEDRENLTMQIRTLESEVSTIKNQKSEDEEKARAKSLKLGKISAEKDSELFALQGRLNKAEEEGSAQIKASSEKIKNLNQDLASLQNEKAELEQQCEKLKFEMDSMHNKKSEVEEQMRAKDHENTELREEILQLQGTITELEKALAERKVELSTLQEKLHGKESEASGHTAQIDNLQKDLVSLQKTKEELERHCEEITEEQSELRDKVAQLEKVSAEKESELLALHGRLNKAEEEGSAQIMASSEQIKNLNQVLASLQNEKAELEQQCEKLKLEVDSIHNKKSEVEEQMRAKDHENTELREEILRLQGTITELEKTLAERKVELSTLQEKLHEKESEASGHTAQIDNLQKDLVSLQKTKEELELHCAKVREEHAESLIMLENEKNDIASKTVDLKRTLEEREDAYRKLKENTVYDMSNLTEKVEGLEVSLCLKNQKLRVTEQLLSETEDSFRKTEEKFQQDQRALEDKNAALSAIITSTNETLAEIVSAVKDSVNSVMTRIETLSLKFSDNCREYDGCISKISHELEVAKDSIREMNKEKQQLKNQRSNLLEQLQGRSEQELALRKTVEKLEAKANKEECEKVNLTTTVVQLQRTVGELQKMMEEKEVGMLDLGEEKREVIRQLCLWIDYHRSRYDYLKDILSKTRRGQRE